jgi:putative heme-binding domain-containing protein
MSKTLATPDAFLSPRHVARCLGLALMLAVGGVRNGVAQGTAPSNTEGPIRPVALWPPGPLEVIAAFARPVSLQAANAMIGRSIAYEDIHSERSPAPAASGPVGRLRIVGARLMDEGRTLVLATDPHPRAARYLLPLPTSRPEAQSEGLRRSTVAYDLSGAEAAWIEGDNPAGEPKWTGWFPSFDLDAVRRLTNGSRPHGMGLPLLNSPGRLVLSTWVRLPPGKVTLQLHSTKPIEDALFGDAQAIGHGPDPDEIFHLEVTVQSRGEPLFLTANFRTGGPGRPLLTKASYRMAGETTDYSVERDRLLLPWAPTSAIIATAAPLAIPDLAGGDFERGRTIYRGDQARCAQCHVFRGEGGKVGPDLTDIASKGRAEIYRSIAAPSATIEPDYTTYTVATKEGQVLSGVVRAEGPGEIRVTDTNARTAAVRRDQIQEIRPSATSIMPPGLAGALGDSAIRDLVAYLTSPAPPPKPASP